MDNSKKVKRIGIEISIVANLLRREIDREHKEDSDLSGVRWWLISYLVNNRDRDIFQKDIEEQFAIRRSSVSKGLKMMEEKGFIHRYSVPYDKRLKKIVLTSKAIALYEKAQKHVQEVEEKLRALLTPQETQIFFEIMEKFKQTLIIE